MFGLSLPFTPSTARASGGRKASLVRKVKGAFLPFRCAVEVVDGGIAHMHNDAPVIVRLSVLNPGKDVVRMPSITLGSLTDENALDRALRDARTQLERQGYALN